ncbi:MAG TPA: DUF1499 domain-containing protein [Burkholderiaceae bacterium]|nr:DUF1499 domain-containing protein [Burkholderiaceae bacterium]HPH14679.1 DUF1499 domain-containing protein [Burkholderiaceae bacterium]
MKILWFLALLVVVLALALIIAGQMGLLAGKAPSRLGVTDGRLKPPSSTPNSVSSQASLYPDHPQQAYATIAPLTFKGDGEAAIKELAQVLTQLPRTVIVTQNADYLYAQSTTALLKFTDDVEFWLDKPNNVIQARSSSRLGRKDLGVNRARVEAIRAAFAEVNSKTPDLLQK